MGAPAFDYDLRVNGSQAVLRITGELDLATADAPDRQLGNVDLRPIDALEVDLTATTFIDSSGLGFLTRLGDRARHAGTAFSVIAREGSAPVRAIRITGLEERLHLVCDRPVGPGASR